MCIACGHHKKVDTFWAKKKNALGEEVKLECPSCGAPDKWEAIKPLQGSLEKGLQELRKKYRIPEDLDKKLLIARYNGQENKVFQGNRWKLNPRYSKLFELQENGEIRQKFNVLSGHEFKEEERPEGLDVELGFLKGQNIPGTQRLKELQRYGVKVLRK